MTTGSCHQDEIVRQCTKEAKTMHCSNMHTGTTMGAVGTIVTLVAANWRAAKPLQTLLMVRTHDTCINQGGMVTGILDKKPLALEALTWPLLPSHSSYSCSAASEPASGTASCLCHSDRTRSRCALLPLPPASSSSVCSKPRYSTHRRMPSARCTPAAAMASSAAARKASMPAAVLPVTSASKSSRNLQRREKAFS